jgi:carboxymethylenebutenolidase
MTDIALSTPDGPMRAILARPANAEVIGGVIMFPHVGGLTDTMRTMAGMVAAGGYLCFVPDLYHRLGTIVLDPQSDDDDAVAIRRIAAASVTDECAMRDTRASIDWLAQQNSVAQPYGAVGFGRGGGLALAAAGTFPDEIAACASILGFGFPDRECIARIHGEIYCAFAEQDDIIPREVPTKLRALLSEIAVPSRVVIHAGAHHPYVFPDRAVHDVAAAANDWAQVFAMFKRNTAKSS